MKKIGIITFHDADNYGALLQTYALRFLLRQYGTQADILNYKCPQLQSAYQLFVLPKPTIRSLLRWGGKLLLSPILLYFRSRFAGFRKKYLTDTKSLSPRSIQNCAKEYDLLISGSDQVFNPRITDFDRSYFLAFNKNISKNYSYAASFGLQLDKLSNEERAFIKENLANFNHISVREKQGADIVQSLAGRQAEVHLDPTLLLNQAQWHQVAVMPKYQNYVLLYLMYKDPELITFAQRLAKAKKCTLLYIATMVDIKKRVPVKHITPTPQEWLGFFLHADYVVTNSFHGFAFSVNFNKNFFLGKLPPEWPVNSRLDNLLDVTGLTGRLYTNFTEHFDEPIAWDSINRKIEEERQNALTYLQEISE